MEQELKEKLEQFVSFRERKNKDKFINKLVFRRLGLVTGPLTQDSVLTFKVRQFDEFGRVFNNYDRLWRKILRDNPSLRGTDYHDKGEYEEAKLEELGYRPMTERQVDSLFKEI